MTYYIITYIHVVAKRLRHGPIAPPVPGDLYSRAHRLQVPAGGGGGDQGYSGRANMIIRIIGTLKVTLIYIKS